MSDKKKLQIPSEDTYKRINFLYQAAYKCYNTNPTDLSLCRYYVYTLQAVAKRVNLQLHPTMKRSMCSRCCMLLIPGVTAMVRHRSKRQKHAVITCLECGTFKRYLTIPGKIPWSESEDNWIDTVIDGEPIKHTNQQPYQKLSKKKQRKLLREQQEKQQKQQQQQEQQHQQQQQDHSSSVQESEQKKTVELETGTSLESQQQQEQQQQQQNQQQQQHNHQQQQQQNTVDTRYMDIG